MKEIPESEINKCIYYYSQILTISATSAERPKENNTLSPCNLIEPK
jgi:hypothetical protein